MRETLSIHSKQPIDSVSDGCRMKPPCVILTLGNGSIQEQSRSRYPIRLTSSEAFLRDFSTLFKRVMSKKVRHHRAFSWLALLYNLMFVNRANNQIFTHFYSSSRVIYLFITHI